jgi:hypothetical protein
MNGSPLHRLRRRLLLLLVVYFFAGAASQKLIPGVDEIFPLAGWSLFSKVPDLEDRYSLLIEEHQGRRLDPPVAFLQAPESMVAGNRYLGRKVVESLGRACDRGETAEVATLRRLLEHDYLRGSARYELIFERYEPLEKWKTGESRERRSVATFSSG